MVSTPVRVYRQPIPDRVNASFARIKSLRSYRAQAEDLSPQLPPRLRPANTAANHLINKLLDEAHANTHQASVLILYTPAEFLESHRLLDLADSLIACARNLQSALDQYARDLETYKNVEHGPTQ